MSHFTVSVIVPEEAYVENRTFICYPDTYLAEDIISDYVKRMMSPYEEDTENPEFLSYDNRVDEILNSYLTDMATMIELPTGENVPPHIGTSTQLREPTDEEKDSNNLIYGVKTNLPYVISSQVMDGGRIYFQVPIDGAKRVFVPRYTVMSLHDFAAWSYCAVSRQFFDVNEMTQTLNDLTFRSPIFGYLSEDSNLVNRIWDDRPYSHGEIHDILQGHFEFGYRTNYNAQWDYYSLAYNAIPLINGTCVSVCRVCDMSDEYFWSQDDEKYHRAYYEIVTGQREATEIEKRQARYYVPRESSAYYRRLYPTYEHYRARNKKFLTFAILSEKHGWSDMSDYISCSDGEKDAKSYEMLYAEHFNKVLHDANPHDVVVALDCHI